MNSESEQSILDELEHLIFDEHKIISYKWAMNHFKIHVQKSKQILSKFVKKFQERLFIHHLITGFKSLTVKHSNPYNSVYVSPKLRKKSKSKINTNSNSNSNNSNNSNNSYMNDSDDDDEDMTQSQGNIDKYQSIYTQILCEDHKLEEEKLKFKKIVNIHIYCIARDEARNIKDFLNQQYEEDYHQQLNITTTYLSKQAAKYAQNKNSLSQHNKNSQEINEMSRFSQISFDQCTTVPSPQLNRALARTKQEIQERERNKNKNKNVKKQINFDETIDNFKKNKNKNQNKNKNGKKNTPPISDKLKGLNLASKNGKKSDDAKSSSLSPNANKNKKSKTKKNDIRGVFAKQKEANKKQQENDKQSQQSQIEEEIEKQQKLSKKKKAGKINNFFNTEAEEKKKAKSKKKATKKKATKSKSKSKSKKKKNAKIGSLKPARKRKRGAMEEEDNNLIPIDYASESSQDDEDMNNGYDGMSDDEEIEAINRSFKTHRNKRRKVMVDSDEEDSDKEQDDDIDLDEIENGDSKSNSPKKLTKRELKKIEHEKELKSRKNNFFGAAKNNPTRKKKKYKIVAESYINDKGMFVTEDKKVTDDEDTDNDNDNNDNEQKEKERVHKFQQIEYDEDDDIDMKNKENSVGKINGNNNKKKKSKSTANKKKKKKVTPKKKKNGSITSFFKKK